MKNFDWIKDNFQKTYLARTFNRAKMMEKTFAALKVYS